MGCRVLLVAQPTSAGVGRCVAQLARAGVADGFDVSVACPADGDLATQAVGSGARWHELSLRRHPEPRDVLWVARFRALLADADVVHLHSAKAGAVGRLALATLGRNRPACIFTPHGWSWLAGGGLAPAYRAFERLLAPVADVIITVSDEERDLGLPVLGRAARRVRVIENGVDLTQFYPTGPARVRTCVPLIVCVGRLSVQKGQDLAITALALLQHEDARLRLVGDGPERQRLAELAQALGLTHRVEWTGDSTDVATELRSADIVVVPSRWDGLSLSLLEAMACGAAVVATRVAGTAALEDVGVVTPPGDPVALALAIDELLADPGRRAALGAAARRRAEHRFELGRAIQRTIQVWKDVAH